jgi:thioredoxin 1
MSTVKISDSTFETDVAKASGYVLVDFWAEWCGPCRAIGPALEELATTHTNVKVTKMNIDENPMTPSKLGIRSIPTLILFKDGQQVATQVGGLPKTELFKWVETNAA